MVSKGEARRMITNALGDAVMATLYRALSIIPDTGGENRYAEYDMYTAVDNLLDAIFEEGEK